MEATLQCYKDILEKSSFSCATISNYYKREMEKSKEIYDKCPAKKGNFCQYKKGQIDTFMQLYNETKKLNGLNLSEDILKKIYIENPARFLRGNK
jgi:hypothetical protein